MTVTVTTYMTVYTKDPIDKGKMTQLGHLAPRMTIHFYAGPLENEPSHTPAVKIDRVCR